MKTRYNENVDIAEQAVYINKLIAGEHKHWIPEKGVENFKFKWSNERDTNGWYTLRWQVDYLYLDREDWWHVTVQRCYNDFDEDYIYWNVYLEKECESRKKWLIGWAQELCHKFKWVRSLKHALYLGEVASELALGLSNYSDFFLTREEYISKDSDI